MDVDIDRRIFRKQDCVVPIYKGTQILLHYYINIKYPLPISTYTILSWRVNKHKYKLFLGKYAYIILYSTHIIIIIRKWYIFKWRFSKISYSSNNPFHKFIDLSVLVVYCRVEETNWVYQNNCVNGTDFTWSNFNDSIPKYSINQHFDYEMGCFI